MRRVLARHPLWARGILTGVPFGCLWALFALLDRHLGWLEAMVTGLCVGVPFGVGQSLVWYVYQRHLFGGRTPTSAQAAAAFAAVKRMSPSGDPQVREATMNVARQCARSSGPWAVLVMLSVVLIGGLVLGLTGRWEGWLSVGLATMVGPWMMVSVSRMQAQGRRYLERAAKDPQPPL